MKFTDFVKSGKVRRANPDVALASSLIKCAQKDLTFLAKIPIDEDSARKIMISYYDTLRSILEAIIATEGYKSYSHEAYTYFLIEKGEDQHAQKFERCRKIRNKLNYYGDDISPEEVKDNIQEITQVIDDLIERYCKNVC